MSGLIWIKTMRHFHGIPERVFRKKLIFEKIVDDKKGKQNYPVDKEIKVQLNLSLAAAQKDQNMFFS